MDKITQSLLSYLNSSTIPHRTLYNSDCGRKNGNPTSTCFTRRTMSIVIDIYPDDKVFYLSSHPYIMFNNVHLSKIRELETKWNRIGTKSTLIIDEDQGTAMPGRYSFKLSSYGFCGQNGIEKDIWKRYINNLVSATFEAKKLIDEILF